MTATLRKSAPVPDHVPAHLVRYFNYRTDPAFLRDPYAAIDALRETRALWTTYEGGYWVLTRAEDIQGAMRQPDLFSNDTRVFRLLASYASPKAKADKADLAKMLTVLDRPEHGMYRRVIAQRFMPKVIETMRPDVTAICTGLIEPLVKKGHCDFIDAFASRFPTTVFLRLMGLPLGDSDRFLGWANNHGGGQGRAEPDHGLSRRRD